MTHRAFFPPAASMLAIAVWQIFGVSFEQALYSIRADVRNRRHMIVDQAPICLVHIEYTSPGMGCQDIFHLRQEGCDHPIIDSGSSSQMWPTNH
jgi:hypothetical protein